MICCITGHRPSGFTFPRDEDNPLFINYLKKLAKEVESLIKAGYDTFITGMAEGADIDFAKTVIMLRNKYKYIKLEAALPYPKPYPKNLKRHQEEYYDILSKCSKCHIVSDHFFRGCMHKRNKFMVDCSDLVLAIWNGNDKGGTWSTIQYARQREKSIRYIMLAEMSDI